ncbi:LOW QUALITY PROTEIN: protein eva-1 homolog A [Myotis lucifugus]|uniref:LOW QUALITY PROTEIN: protein eva-1 homolog A n=1 Tax=Myotis lucifugus TaxID=59463 RepID=UPI000CCC4209|nr:LOW QUALITY PROTEIN: protein eva-1 homolog A [Myotis lucifugus]
MQTLPEVINPSAAAAAGFRHWEAIWDLNEGCFPGVLATETRLQVFPASPHIPQYRKDIALRKGTEDNLFLPLTRAPPASAGLGAIAGERRGRDPAPRAVPGGSSIGVSLPGASAGPSPRHRLVPLFPGGPAAGPPARPRAPRAQPPEVRAGGPGEEPEKPTGANQVSGPVLLGTNVTRDELFLPEIPLFLTAHLPQKRREGGATLIPLKHLREAPLDATWRLPFRRSTSTEPLTAQRRDMALLSSILATYSFVSDSKEREERQNTVSAPAAVRPDQRRGQGFCLAPLNPRAVGLQVCRAAENPKRAALYFVSGVCLGLVLTPAALVMRLSCRVDCRRRSRPGRSLPDQESSSDSSDSSDSEDGSSDISVRRHRRFERTLNKNVFTSAEELEAAQRLEERERIIREIWMNGQPEVPGTRSLNRYY